MLRYHVLIRFIEIMGISCLIKAIKIESAVNFKYSQCSKLLYLNPIQQHHQEYSEGSEEDISNDSSKETSEQWWRCKLRWILNGVSIYILIVVVFVFEITWWIVEVEWQWRYNRKQELISSLVGLAKKLCITYMDIGYTSISNEKQIEIK